MLCGSYCSSSETKHLLWGINTLLPSTGGNVALPMLLETIEPIHRHEEVIHLNIHSRFLCVCDTRIAVNPWIRYSKQVIHFRKQRANAVFVCQCTSQFVEL